MSGRLILAIYLGCLILAAWAILRAIDHFRGRPLPVPPWQEDDDGVQPLDIYVITLADQSGAFSRN